MPPSGQAPTGRPPVVRLPARSTCHPRGPSDRNDSPRSTRRFSCHATTDRSPRRWRTRMSPAMAHTARKAKAIVASISSRGITVSGRLQAGCVLRERDSICHSHRPRRQARFRPAGDACPGATNRFRCRIRQIRRRTPTPHPWRLCGRRRPNDSQMTLFPAKQKRQHSDHNIVENQAGSIGPRLLPSHLRE